MVWGGEIGNEAFSVSPVQRALDALGASSETAYAADASPEDLSTTSSWIRFDVGRYTTTAATADHANGGVYYRLTDVEINSYNESSTLNDKLQSIQIRFPNLTGNVIQFDDYDAIQKAIANTHGEYGEWQNSGTYIDPTTNETVIDFVLRDYSNVKLPSSATTAQAECILGQFRFYSTQGGSDKGEITVQFSADSVVSWTDPEGDRQFYRAVPLRSGAGIGWAGSDGVWANVTNSNTNVSWPEAYNYALSTSFAGLQGYPATITSLEEAQTLNNYVDGQACWSAGTRARYSSVAGGYRSGNKIGQDANGKPDLTPIPTRYSNYASPSPTDTVDVNKEWYWAAGPSEDYATKGTADTANGGIFYKKSLRDSGSSSNASYSDASSGIFSYWKDTGEPNNSNSYGIGAFGSATQIKESQGATDGKPVSDFPEWKGEDALVLGYSNSVYWNDEPMFGYLPSARSVLIEYSEGWAGEGGGAYTPISTVYSASLPMTLTIRHLDSATNLQIAADAPAPSSGLDAAKTWFTPGAADGGLDLAGYAYDRADPTNGMNYTAGTQQQITYYYSRTTSSLTDPVSYRVKKDGAAYRLDDVFVSDGFGGVRQVKIEYPAALTLTSASGTDPFGSAATEGAWSYTDVAVAGTTTRTYTLAGGLNYAYEASPATVAGYLADLRFGLPGGQRQSGQIHVSVSNFSDVRADTKGVSEPIPQPVTVNYYQVGTTTTVRASEIYDGATDEAYTVTTHPDMSAGGLTPAGITVDGVSQTAGHAVAYTAAPHTVNYYYAPKDGFPVTFEMDGHGEAVPRQMIANGSKATRPADPIEPGWRFVNWYKENIEEEFNFDAPITGPTTAYALWTSESAVSVAFTDDGQGVIPGTMPNNIPNLPYNSVLSASAIDSEPLIVGKIRTGWTIYPGGGAFTPDVDRVTQRPLTLKPVFENYSAPVAYIFNGGEQNNTWRGFPPSGTTSYAALIPSPSGFTPEADGYKFAGWHTASTGGESFDFTRMRAVNSTTVVYAHWTKAPDVTVSFHWGAESDAFDMPENATLPYDGALPGNLREPKTVGSKFLYWKLPDGSRVSLSGAAETPTRFRQNTQVTAAWESMDPAKVTFAAEGYPFTSVSAVIVEEGTMPPAVTLPYNSPVSEDTITPVVLGYSFLGWFPTEDNSSSSVTFDASSLNRYRATVNATLYAHWQPESTHRVDFKPEGVSGMAIIGGTGQSAMENVKYNQTISPLTPQSEGHMFKGWYVADDEWAPSATRFTPGPKGDRVTTDLKLIASWEAIDDVTIKFDGNAPGIGDADNVPDPMIGVTYASIVTQPAKIPEYKGWKFVGWAARAEEGGLFDFVNGRITPDGAELTLYARWTPADPVNVAYEANAPSGTVVAGTMPVGETVPYSGAVAPPDRTPILVGYSFDTWYDAASGGVAFKFGETRLTTNTSIYAAWTKEDDPKITYVKNAGDDPVFNMPDSPRGVSYAAIRQKPSEVPIRVGYRFDDWYTTAECVTKFAFTTTRITEDKDLYAGWKEEPAKKTVSFSGNMGGIVQASLPASYESAYNALFTGGTYSGGYTEPVAPGYEFKGWFTQPSGGVEYTTATRVSDNVLLYAHWAPKDPVDVKYDANDSDSDSKVVPGSMPKDVEDVLYNSTLTEPADKPRRAGYTFKGWFHDGGSAQPWRFGASGDRLTEATTTIYAGWTPVPDVKVTYAYSDPDINTDKIKPADGGFGGLPTEAVPVSYGGLLPPLKETPYAAGYKYEGLYGAPDSTADPYTAGVTITTDKAIYARMTKVSDKYVTFDANVSAGAPVGMPQRLSVKYNGFAQAPAQPILEGYVFGGWYKDTNFAEAFDFTVVSEGVIVTEGERVTENTPLFAKWSVGPTHSVTFAPNAQSIETPTNMPPTISGVAHNARIVTPSAIPVTPGYKFTGWYTTAAMTDKFDFINTRVADDLTLYAGWSSLPQVTLSLNLNGPEHVGVSLTDGNYTDQDGGSYTKQGLNGAKFPRPENPVSDNQDFKFLGWYTSSTGNELFDFENTPVAENVTVYARWGNTARYIVRFDGNPPGGKSIVDGTMPSNLYVDAGYQDTIDDPGVNPVVEGYRRIDGWYTTNGAVVPADQFIFGADGTPITENTVLYAHWASEGAVNVTFHPNGAGVTGMPANPGPISYNSPVQDPATSPQLLGYEFDGWYDAPTGGSPYGFGARVVTNTAIYAHWQGKSNVTITYLANIPSGGSPVITGTMPAPDTLSYGALSVRPVKSPEREGYAFDDWYEAPTGTTEFAFTQVKQSRDVYAHWLTMSGISINFVKSASSGIDVREGTWPSDLSAPYNGVPGAPTVMPEAVGYVFDRWMTAASGGLPFDFTTRRTETAPAYPSWIAKPDVLISFDANKPAEAPKAPVGMVSSRSVSYGGIMPGTAEFILPGYAFAGWYDAQEGGGKYTPGDEVYADGPLTLYAHWTQKTTTLTLTFNLNKPDGDYESGTMPSNVTGILYNDVAIVSGTAPEKIPVVTGYMFTGWYAAQGGGESYDFSSRMTESDAVYAGWIPKEKVTVTYHENDDDSARVAEGTMPQDQPYDYNERTVTPSAIPMRAGYAFVGWYAEASGAGAKFVFGEHIVQDAPLFAKWDSRGSQNFIFNANTPSAVTVIGAPPDRSVLFGTKTAPPSTSPVALGYEFLGWYTEANGGIPYDFAGTYVTGERVVYARWAPRDPVEVNFDGNNSFVIASEMPDDIQSLTYGAFLPAATKEPVAPGWRFLGWAKTPAGAPVSEYVRPGETRISADVRLYAQWTKEGNVEFAFDINKEAIGEATIIAPAPSTQTGISYNSRA
jgi:uncharacterized repeat protein (TIGR02543 family)